MGRPRYVLPWLLSASACAATAIAQTQPVVDAPPAAAPPVAPDAPRGLLPVAEAEAARSTGAMKERILGMLRNFATQRDTAADRGKGFLDNVVLLGPDAVPLLLDVLRDVDKGSFDAAYAGAAARALCGIFERTKNKAILASLSEAVQASGPAVKAGALEGLETLDHPQVVDIVSPLLESKDPSLRARAVRVLGRQKGSAELVGGLLKPLLSQQGAPWADVVSALRALEDESALDLVHGMVAKSEELPLLLAGVGYVSDLGGRTSIEPLRSLLMRPGSTLPETLLKQAVDAVQAIGLRETDAHSPAEQLLVETFKKLRESKKVVSDHARWQLGPYKNDEALKSLEDEIDAAIAMNRRVDQPNTMRYLELAGDRLHFESWGRALDALKKAKEEDSRKLRTSDIDELKAVALCGQQKYSQSKALLQEIHPDRRFELLQTYPVLQKMAKDPNYKDLFPAPAK
jgi:hypothetical protein